MNVTVRIPTPIRQYTEQQPEVALEGKTVGEVIEAFKARFPEAGAKFFSSNSRASRSQGNSGGVISFQRGD